jgi:sulfatase maturation enzyme AslB (radical SAM superfamily)
MNLHLSYYGWMVTRHLVRTGLLRLGDSPENDLLLDLWTGTIAPYADSPLHNFLLAEGLVEFAEESVGMDEVQLRYARNPFEYFEKVIFEFTTFCNFNCDHCYNAQVPRLTESNPRLLMQAADTFLRMGIRRFDFVGGEVSRYGNGWLDLVEHIRSRGGEIVISLYTNGWWLERENFEAAGQFFASDQAYLAELAQCGVNHVTFSLDGQNEKHDQSRHQPGLYQKILNGFEKVKQAGLLPRVSLLVRPNWTAEQAMAFLAESATLIYDLDPILPERKRALRLSLDSTNSISSFIDIGNGAGDEQVQFPILDKREHALYCRNFYRLSPSLTIKANGELATCRLSQAGEGYGNLHERPLVDILNRFDEAFVYQLHASRSLEDYLPLVDRSLFGDAFTHLCSLRSIVTLLARKMHEQGVSPDDSVTIQHINREVAALTGHARGKL